MSIELTDVAERMRLEVVVWIVANNGCGNGDEARAAEDRVSCLGASGRFRMIGCPLFGYCKGRRVNSVEAGKTFLYEYFKWHGQQKAEAAKKQEQAVKPEPKKICGACRYTPKGIVDFNQIVLCEKRGRVVPASFDGCSFFERTIEKSVLERLSADTKSGAEAAKASSKIAVEYLSGAEKEEIQGETGCRWVFRPSATLPPDVSVSDVICAFMASAPQRRRKACAASPDAERIAQLEKENAELQSTNKHLREELVWQFEQLLSKIGTLQDQNAKLREKLDAAAKEKNSAGSRLVEHLKQMGQRIKDLEREISERSWPPRPRFFL